MTDPNNDIDALLRYLSIINCPVFHAALTALVAERDRLRTERDDAKTRFNHAYLQRCDFAKRIDEANEIVARYKQQRDEARRMYCVEAARHSVCRRSMMDKQTIAEMNGWHCFAQKEGGGA